MSRLLAGIAALTLIGAAAMPVTASAAERQAGASDISTVQSTDLSSHRRYWRHRHWRHRHWGYHRPYWRPRYGYYRPRWRPRYYGYRHYGYPYRYGYRHYRRPGLTFGFRVF